jgi:hypothetical protein
MQQAPRQPVRRAPVGLAAGLGRQLQQQHQLAQRGGGQVLQRPVLVVGPARRTGPGLSRRGEEGRGGARRSARSPRNYWSGQLQGGRALPATSRQPPAAGQGQGTRSAHLSGTSSWLIQQRCTRWKVSQPQVALMPEKGLASPSPSELPAPAAAAAGPLLPPPLPRCRSLFSCAWRGGCWAALPAAAAAPHAPATAHQPPAGGWALLAAAPAAAPPQGPGGC